MTDRPTCPARGAAGEARCSHCVRVHKFNPRRDEIDRGLTIGCKKPGWEGYSHDDAPACGGVFFSTNIPIHVKTEAARVQ